MMNSAELYELALDNEKKGNYRIAIELLEKAHRNDTSFLILNSLARLYHREKEITIARKLYKSILLDNPFFIESIVNLSLLECNEGNHIKALRTIKLSFFIKNKSFKQEELISNAVTKIFAANRLYKEAINILKKQIKLQPTSSKLANYAYLNYYENNLSKSVRAQSLSIENAFRVNNIRFSNDSFLNNHFNENLDSIKSKLLVNYSMYLLSIHPYDYNAHRFLLFGIQKSISHSLFDLRRRLWQGHYVKNLFYYDDMGFGDTIRGLLWIDYLSKKADKVSIFIRPSFFDLISKRINTPINVNIKSIDQFEGELRLDPLAETLPINYAGLSSNSWNKKIISGLPKIQRSSPKNKFPRIGLNLRTKVYLSTSGKKLFSHRNIPVKLFLESVHEWSLMYSCSFHTLLNEETIDSRLIKEIEGINIKTDYLNKDSWEESASKLETFDMLISVDTALAHLAGIMDIPCILMLNSPADWRWHQSGCKTTIYPSFKIARCKSRDDWISCIEKVSFFLDEFLANHHSS